MNPLGAVITLVLLGLIFGGSRLTATLSMMAGVLFLTQAQVVSLGGFHVFAFRFLEMAGFIRVFSRGEFSFSRMNKIDKYLLQLYIYCAVVYSARSDEGIAYTIGACGDAVLAYFTFRGLVHDMADLRAFLKAFVFMLAPFTLLVMDESLTKHNPFSILGGVNFGWLRNGRLRCMGSFRNPDLLGTVGASFMPLYVAMALSREERKRGYIGMMLCVMVVFFCNSGGPVSATAVGMVGWGLWRIRTRMKAFRRGLVIFIALAAMLMKAPVWYLIARVSELTGGDGWHRSYLMDVAYRHLGSWWMFGMPIAETADWFPYSLTTTGAADITNQFISIGLMAGLGAVTLFILKLKSAFSMLGTALNLARQYAEASENEMFLWGLGVMLAAHIINWFGITYFDQSCVMWFMQLAMISGVAQHCIESSGEVFSRGVVRTEGNGVPEPQMEYEPIV